MSDRLGKEVGQRIGVDKHLVRQPLENKVRSMEITITDDPIPDVV